jgi:CubicO group peptidase (beta-lactamase class C family)
VIRTISKSLGRGLVILALFVSASHAQFVNRYDYDKPIERVIYSGMQALLTCNGLFVSNRTLDQLNQAELKMDLMPLVPPEQVTIDRERKTVAIPGPGAVMRAAYREGLGCVVMGPAQTFADINKLPILNMPPPSGDISNTPWPDGDLVRTKPLPNYIDQKALDAASEFAFDRKTYGNASQITMSLLVVHKGEIILERYAPGVDMTTKTRTWSTAKSIAATLIGIAVRDGKLALDAPLPFKDWGPGQGPAPETDPRRKITLRNVLNMSSGLYPIDDVSVTGSMLSYFGGASSVRGALDRGLIREPGTTWDYENYDSLLGVYALKTALHDPQTYREFPRRALFDQIGMRNTVVGMDRFGDYVLSSQIYTNARDLARLGLLYLNEGVWNGKRILPESWIRFVRTPAPATEGLGRLYGGQFWLVPDGRTDLPQDAYSTAGSRGQFTIIIPSYDLVIVRRGEDWLSEAGFSNWDLAHEVLKAFPKRAGGEKPKH